ncbi:MAG: hypothetical protein IOB84_12560 [Brevundimonas sp.]|nr:hypothetical protein [Brevundimonas sp.]
MPDPILTKEEHVWLEAFKVTNSCQSATLALGHFREQFPKAKDRQSGVEFSKPNASRADHVTGIPVSIHAQAPSYLNWVKYGGVTTLAGLVPPANGYYLLLLKNPGAVVPEIKQGFWHVTSRAFESLADNGHRNLVNDDLIIAWAHRPALPDWARGV